MSTNETQVSATRSKYALLLPNMDERRRRLWAAAEAQSFGKGGVAVVSLATGISRPTIYRGLAELAQGDTLESTRAVRREGGGRKHVRDTDETLLVDLDRLVEPTSRGDPESPLRWTSKSARALATELGRMGHCVSHQTVYHLLQETGYSLQANRKDIEGASHPDRDAQFRHINAQVQDFAGRGQPVISVDAKKKELVGDFKHAGREWQPIGEPERVRVHDFMDPALGKAIPYGVYDLTNNAAWVSVGTDHDTAAFAANTILTWWEQMGKHAYPDAAELLITADGGGSNSHRSRLWKTSLQSLANRTGLTIRMAHFPPGTSKWNKIEHRLFSFITQNWRGRPLTSHETIVKLIGSTTTQTGLKVAAAIDNRTYPTGTVISDDEITAVKMTPMDFHGDWNYTIRSRWLKYV